MGPKCSFMLLRYFIIKQLQMMSMGVLSAMLAISSMVRAIK
jgi:hypothetical protein